MTTPQMGIFALGDSAHSFLELDMLDATTATQAVRAVADIHDPRTTPEGVNLVVGFRPELWRIAAPSDAPRDGESFATDLIGPDGYRMPATQSDLFFWIAGASYDSVFDVGGAIVDQLKPVATVARELSGWTYQHNRDLTGFQDGTKNPSLIEAPDVALVADGRPGAGGSIVLFQQWKHEVAAWRALPVAAQERVIGRTKPDSLEFDAARMPPDSHVSRSTLEENGAELPIFRRNTAYGGVNDHGTIFVGFSKEQRRLRRMLERMAGIGDGVRDALTRYSEPLTGAYYFVPALSTLARFAEAQG